MPRIHDPATGRFTTKAKLTEKALGASEMRNELGVSSKRRMGRTLYDDFLPVLRGPSAARIYTEMSNNDPTIGNILFAVDMLLRELDWFTEPAEHPRGEEAAKLVEECMDDMSHPFSDHISAALSFVPHGFSVHEIVYRMRLHSEGSKFDDGKWGWRKFAFRPQDSIDEMLLDETGGYEAVRQGDVLLPIEKLIVYRTSAQYGPTGRSAFRNAYVPWFYLKRSQGLMMTGVERDLAGLPVMRMPADDILGQTSVYEYVKDVATKTKRDEQEGVVLPSDRDEHGEYLYDFELMAPAGGAERLNGVLSITRSFAADISGVVAADFVSLGRDAVGSRALAEPKVKLFLRALEAWADVIADILTRHPVPRLLTLNGFPPDAVPQVTHSNVEEMDLGAIGEFIDRTAKAGFPWFGVPEDPIEAEVREMAGFDPLPQHLADEALAMREEERENRQQFAAGFAANAAASDDEEDDSEDA